jgi:hypothetical protein
MENIDVIKALVDEVIGDRPFKCNQSPALLSKTDVQLSLVHKEKYMILVTKITIENSHVSFLDNCASKGTSTWGDNGYFHNVAQPDGAAKFQKSIGVVIDNFLKHRDTYCSKPV